MEGALQRRQNVPTPFSALFDSIDACFSAGGRYVADTLWLAGEPTDLLMQVAERIRRCPSRDALTIGVVMAPPPPDPPPLPDCAFSMVGPVHVSTYAVRGDAADDAANLGWLRQTGEASRLYDPRGVFHAAPGGDLV